MTTTLNTDVNQNGALIILGGAGEDVQGSAILIFHSKKPIVIPETDKSKVISINTLFRKIEDGTRRIFRDELKSREKMGGTSYKTFLLFKVSILYMLVR